MRSVFRILPPFALPLAGTAVSQAPLSRLTYQVPAGWTSSGSGGAVTLARSVDLGFGQKQAFRITIGAPGSVAGNPVDAFRALWKATIGAMSTTQFYPLPLRVRLRGGATLLYDGT